MNKSFIIGGIVILAALILAMFSFKSSLTNYVTIKEAMITEQFVQVAGLLDKKGIGFDDKQNLLIFTLKEQNGDSMIVYYNKSKPANFENAEKIVAIGQYNKSKQAFIANELLVKCPSKYEGRFNKK